MPRRRPNKNPMEFLVVLAPLTVLMFTTFHYLPSNTTIVNNTSPDNYVHSDDEFWTATVKRSYAAVRRKPYSSSLAIGYVYKEESYSVLSTSGRWIEIDLNGSRGWVEEESVSLTGSQTFAPKYITLTLNNYVGNFADEFAISYDIVSVSSKYAYMLSHTIYLLGGEWYVEYVAVDKYGNMASERQRSYFDQLPTSYEEI